MWAGCDARLLRGRAPTQGGKVMNTLLQDLRYAWRTLVKSRLFTATALAVLALGIGANTTIYTIVRGIALRPLPFDQQSRLMFIGEVSPSGRREAIAPANFVDLARQSRTFEQMAIHRGARFVLTGRPVPESVSGANVSSTFFATLRVQPQRGRDFLAQDESVGGTRAAILSHRGWLRLFSEDRAIVGRTITLDGIDHTVVGILPAGFSLWETDIWVAGFDSTLMANRVAHNVGAIGRLKERISLDQARAELDTIGPRLAMAYPATNTGWAFRTLPLQEAWLGEYRPTSMVLLGAVAMVLLIACANLANLLLERALARDREMFIRLALGAGRSRVVRQMLTESLLLALTGGAVGVLAASWSLSLVVALIPGNTLMQIPGGINAIHLDLHTLGIALGMSLGTGILFGLAPAARLKRLEAEGALRESVRGASGGREGYFWRRTLVVVQMALSTILLIGAALMVQSLWHLQRLDRGYMVENALSVTLLLPQAKYPEPRAREAFFSSVIERIRGLPGVTRVGAMALLSARGRPFVVEGQPPSSRDAAPIAIYRVATPEFLATMGIPLMMGRDFSQNDRTESPGVAIVNRTLARVVWPTGDPVGRRLQLLMPAGDTWVTVIGVASDVRESLDPRSTRWNWSRDRQSTVRFHRNRSLA